MTYFDALTKAMEWLGSRKDTIFIGQAVSYPGTAMYNTLSKVPEDKRMEMPVAEEMQMGISAGLALAGYTPISIFPRWNFLLCGMSGLVNHIDKYPLISDFKMKVIIRTGIGSVNPLDPQWQHKGDFTGAIKNMCKTVNVVRLEKPEQVFPEYYAAYNSNRSTILVETSDFLNETFRSEYNKFRLTYGGA
jgi:pyruvate/2-oxoglutarate/acetoin dehydrogenase E1 component